MKKTLALFLAMMMVFSCGIYAIELDTAEDAAETVAEEAVLAANASVELKPGLNIWTGTTAPYTFDGDEATIDTEKFVISGAKVVDKDSNGNNSLVFNKQFQYMALKNELFPVIEVSRPVRVTMKVLQHNGQVRLCAADRAPNAENDTLWAAADVWTNNSGTVGARSFDVIATQTFTYITNNSSMLKPSSGKDEDPGDTWKKPYQGSSFANLYLYKYSNNNYGAYYDDISIIPYYAIHFENNGGIGSNPLEYFYVEPGQSYTIKTPANFYTKDGKPSLGWAFTPDATEPITSFVPTPGKDITLYAVYDEDFVEDDVKPGLNLFTGTEEKLTFDGEGFDLAALTHIKTNSVTVGTKATNDNADNKALVLDKQGDYISFVNFPKTYVDRPFDIDIDMIYSGQIRYMAVDAYTSTLRENANSIVIYGKSATNWTHLDYTISGSQTTSTGTGGYLNNGYQQRMIPNIYVYMYSGISSPTYIDNLNITPYYRITYDANGGTGSAQAAEYFYVAQGKTYTLKNTKNDLVKGDLVFLGWATKPDATSKDIVTAIKPTLGEDVTLYAVYGKPITVTYMKDGEVVETVETTAGTNITVYTNLYTAAGADSWYLSWVNEEETINYNIASIAFDEDVVLHAVERSKTPVIGENFVVNGDLEGVGMPLRNTSGISEIVDGGDEEHGKIIKYTRGGGYSKLGTCINWEKGRKYRIECDIKTPIAASTCYCPTYGGKENAFAFGNTTANTWTHLTADYTYTSDAEANSGDALTIYVNPMANVENIVYYDNIYIAPYHKVTFNANGAEGTAPAVDWTLAETYTITADEGEMFKDGYYLAGWATSADGEVVESVATESGKDIELFAVWAPVADENAPASNSDDFSMRAGDKAGMRFYASVTAAQKNEAVEYGFIAARADILNTIGVNAAELTLGLTYNGHGEGKLFVKGAAYVKDGDTVTLDKFIEETDDGDVIFAAVCTGLDITNKTQVTTKFVVRPYINIGGVYAYGKPVVKSLYEVAQTIDTTDLPADIIEYIDAVITTATAE